MNLFFKKLTGALLTTEKVEARIAPMPANIARYRQIDTSEELAEYKGRRAIGNAREVQAEKQHLTQTKYKETAPYKTLAELRRLEKNKALQLYFFVGESALLAEYLAFRESEDYVKLADKKEVSKSPDLKRLQKFEKSKAYRTWPD